MVVNELGEWVGPAPTVAWSDIEGMPEDFADGIDDDTDTDTDSFAALGTSCLDGDIPVWDSVLVEWVCDMDQDTLADPGEAPEACAHREVIEEVGLAVGQLHPLGPILTTPGFTDERIWLYAATDLTPAPQALEEDEVIEVIEMPLTDALQRIAAGEITDSKTIAAILRVDQEMRAGRLQTTLQEPNLTEEELIAHATGTR